MDFENIPNLLGVAVNISTETGMSRQKAESDRAPLDRPDRSVGYVHPEATQIYEAVQPCDGG